MKRSYGAWWLTLVVAAITLSVITYKAATAEEPNTAAIALLQVLVLLLGLVGSYFFGRNAAADAAQDVLRPHAASSFRLVKNLYEGLGRVSSNISLQSDLMRQIASGHNGAVPEMHVVQAMQLLHVQATEQLGTATNALEAWRDIVPDEIAALERRASERGASNE